MQILDNSLSSAILSTFFTFLSPSWSWRIRRVSCSLILEMKLIKKEETRLILHEHDDDDDDDANVKKVERIFSILSTFFAFFKLLFTYCFVFWAFEGVDTCDSLLYMEI